MEPKKIKKLVLKKEMISDLSNYEQNVLKGGNGCIPSRQGGTCTVLSVVMYVNGLGNPCDDSGGGNPNDTSDTNYSQVGSGCDAETCGWAWTCNGR